MGAVANPGASHRIHATSERSRKWQGNVASSGNAPQGRYRRKVSEMRCEQVDPRDQGQEHGDPSFQVYFWGEGGASDEWQITGGDLDEVQTWAAKKAEGRDYSLWAVVPPGARESEVILLRGMDPNDPGNQVPNDPRNRYSNAQSSIFAWSPSETD